MMREAKLGSVQLSQRTTGCFAIEEITAYVQAARNGDLAALSSGHS
jgi:hypothetical protein